MCGETHGDTNVRGDSNGDTNIWVDSNEEIELDDASLPSLCINHCGLILYHTQKCINTFCAATQGLIAFSWRSLSIPGSQFLSRLDFLILMERIFHITYSMTYIQINGKLGSLFAS